ncbi:MAG: bacillithiol biosynthesis cysteine-adding enzyme BshC, partial [Acidobacteriota bacterium]
GTTELPPRPVGDIRLPENIRQVIAAYGASIPGDRNHEVEAQLASACQPGSTFAEAFGRLMAQLFRDRGLILFDPRNSGAKKLAAPVMRNALLEAQGLRTRLLKRSQALRDAGLEPQVAVLPRSTLVFLEDEGERRLLVTGEGDFLLKDTSKHFALEKLLDLVENEPLRFSPNVLLRPVVQDHLFPTAAYIGGPAEVSYFAQVEPLYRVYNRPMPVVWPRAGFTVLDADTCSTLERYGLHLEDCLQGESHVIRRILQAQPARFEIVIDELRRAVDRGIEELKPSLMAADASLGPAADTARRKLLHRVASLRTKFVNFEMRHNRVLHDEVLQLLNSCCPDGNLQERELGAYYLLSRHGPSLLDILYELVDLEAFAHRTVCIQDISA